MRKRVIPFFLQLPLLLVIIASFFGSIYAVIEKIGGVSLAVPIILFIVIALYFYGKYLENKKRDMSY